MRKAVLLVLLVAAAALALGALGGCASAEPTPTLAPSPAPAQPTAAPTSPPAATPTGAAEPVPTAAEPAPTAAVGEPGEVREVALEIPFLEEWAGSDHADETSEAWAHWNEDDPAVVPVACARCHSTTGYISFVGGDGTAFGAVEEAPVAGEALRCVGCHNAGTVRLDEVTFPSGVHLDGLGPEARCMQCHQGRASTVQVDGAIEAAAVADADAISEDLGFVNIHYYAAAATRWGSVALGGYQYEGKAYDVRFDHVEPLDTCVECHDVHSLEVRVGACRACHDVDEVEDLRDVRFLGSLADYDGDGDMEEGIAREVEGLQGMLYRAIQAYGAQVVEQPIVYSPDTHPYFFADPNGNGTLDEGEAVRDNQYASWTPRLLRAAYNYQTSLKDPGAYTHNAKYVIQLLYDSIEDLNAALAEPVDLSTARRDDPGHFQGSSEAFRHWDAEGEVPAGCATCHAAEGVPFRLEHGVQIAQEPGNGLACSTCHDSVFDFTLHTVAAVTFPSGATLGFEQAESNVCLHCHQGRASTEQVDARIGEVDDDDVSEDVEFLNVHYFAAAATLFGSEASGAYEYAGQEYAGRFAHVSGYDTCAECHDAHRLTVRAEACGGCHEEVEGPEGVREIRMQEADFDGDGDADEGLYFEVDTMRERLYEAIQAYAADVVGTPIVYSSTTHPYYFLDTNADGALDEGEAVRANQYVTWTPRLLRAAYNYQYVTKDPGAFTHNGTYILQVLYDSLADVGAAVEVDMADLVRPDMVRP